MSQPSEERPTRRVIDVKSSCTFARNADDTWTAHFPTLDVTGSGPSEQEAWQSLVEALQDKLSTDESVRPMWEAFVAEHSHEEEIPEDELEEERRMVEASHQASAGFRVLALEDVDSAIASPSPVLVDFWAEWCMPCHMIAPVLKEVADELAGRLEVMKLNVEDHGDAWQRFAIQGIPTMIVFRAGEEVLRIVGAGRTKEEFLDELAPALA